MDKRTPEIKLERVYDDPQGETDGFRMFVDRLWPRGESKAKFHYDLWAKDITPSTSLREWYHADHENRWEEFCKRYYAELVSNPNIPALVKTLEQHRKIVILTAARDVEHSHVPILAKYLAQQLSEH